MPHIHLIIIEIESAQPIWYNYENHQMPFLTHLLPDKTYIYIYILRSQKPFASGEKLASWFFYIHIFTITATTTTTTNNRRRQHQPVDAVYCWLLMLKYTATTYPAKRNAIQQIVHYLFQQPTNAQCTTIPYYKYNTTHNISLLLLSVDLFTLYHFRAVFVYGGLCCVRLKCNSNCNSPPAPLFTPLVSRLVDLSCGL